MAVFRRAILATALVGTGLAATTGAAFATEQDSDAPQNSDQGTSQEGLVNVGDVQTIVPTNVCNNDVPVNALGVQVPLQNLAADIPLLSSSDDGGNSSSVNKNCGSGVAAQN